MEQVKSIVKPVAIGAGTVAVADKISGRSVSSAVAGVSEPLGDAVATLTSYADMAVENPKYSLPIAGAVAFAWMKF